MARSEQMTVLAMRGTWCPRADSGWVPNGYRAERGDHFWKDVCISLETAPVPEIEDDDVLVKVAVCGICGSDTHCLEHDAEGYVQFSGPLKLPGVLGHELAGRVERVGKRVTHVKVGELVTAESVWWCGGCRPCRGGHPNQCERIELMGFTRPGALADKVVVKERYCWSLEPLRAQFRTESHLLETAALIEPVGCAYNGMFVEAGGFRPGAFVVVWGAGPIGLASVALARLAGAAKVIAIEPIEERRHLASRLGADVVLTPGPGIGREIRSRLGGGADIQVEAAGAASIEEMEAAFAPGSTLVYLGRVGAKLPLTMDRWVTNAARVVGARGHAGAAVFGQVIRLLASGRLQLDAMITRRVGLAEVTGALASSSDRRDGKILVHMDQPD